MIQDCIDKIWLPKWLASLATTERDKKILQCGSVLFVMLMLYMIFSLSINHVSAQRLHIKAEQQTWQRMQTAAAIIDQMQMKEAHATNISNTTATPPLLVERLGALQTEIARAHLMSHLTLLKQTADNHIALAFKKVDFDQLMQLILIAEKKEALTLTQLHVTATATPGVVEASLQLV